MEDLNVSLDSLSDAEVEQLYIPTKEQVNAFTQEESQDSQYQENQEEQTNTEPQEDSYDYKGAVEYITAPLKAAGGEFTFKNLEEIRTLASMGLDYTKKMQGISARKAELMALDKAGMLGDNLNYAIDIFSGNPQAIKKLLKDKNIDINSLGSNSGFDEFGNPIQEQPVDYQPTNYSPSTEEVELQSTIDDLKKNPVEYKALSEAFGNFSKQDQNEILKNPHQLRALNEHVQNGLYKYAMDEIAHNRIMQNPAFTGKSDLEAYTMIMQSLVDNEMQRRQTEQQQAMQYQQQQQAMMQQQAIQQRKQAVAPNRVYNQRNTIPVGFDPLTATDEEIEKISFEEFFKRNGFK